MRPENVEPGSPEAWLRYARSDLALASADAPADVLPVALCFHAQQAAEKALKAVLVHVGTPITKTHNIRFLVDRLPVEISVPDWVDRAAILTKYAVQLRYPEDVDEVTESELQDALLLGRNVLEWAERIVRNQD